VFYLYIDDTCVRSQQERCAQDEGQPPNESQKDTKRKGTHLATRTGYKRRPSTGYKRSNRRRRPQHYATSQPKITFKIHNVGTRQESAPGGTGLFVRSN
ncbi:hypothetical protein, partial [Acinetobacter baumannii]|uniref:hypothetical protein n=1 Tax=Acinetobacter baumannii TaxID=470 RepID=UPI001C07E73C